MGLFLTNKRTPRMAAVFLVALFLAVPSTTSSATEKDWFKMTTAAFSTRHHRILQQPSATTNVTTTTGNDDDSAANTVVICANLRQELYGDSERLKEENPCVCQRLAADDRTTNTTNSSYYDYYQLHCRYEYCPACDPVTGLCAIRDETHTYLVTYPPVVVVEEANYGLPTMTDRNDDNTAPPQPEYLYVNATFCRVFVPPVSSSAMDNTTKRPELPPTFCVSNSHYPARTAIHQDYTCQIWIDNGEPPNSSNNNTCRSCRPQVCETTTSTTVMRTSYDCTNLPQGTKASYCGIQVEDAVASTGVGGILLDQHANALGIERASPFAAALYNYEECRRYSNHNDDGVMEEEQDGGIGLMDVEDIDNNGDAEDVNLDYEDANAMSTSSSTNDTTTGGNVNDKSRTATVQSLSVSDDGSVIGVGLWNQYYDSKDNLVEDIQVTVYKNNNIQEGNADWVLHGLPVTLEDGRTSGYRNETYTVDTTPVFVRLTPDGESMVVGHRQRDWDAYTHAYNGWPIVGHKDDIPDTFRYKINQRLAIANPKINNNQTRLTVARVNHPSPTSAHATYESTPMVEVWDLVPPFPSSADSRMIGPWQWQLRPISAEDFSPTENIRMSDISLSADGLRYAAGATGLPFVFVKEWHPQDNTAESNSTGSWKQIGSGLAADDRRTDSNNNTDTHHSDDGFGYRVSLSSNGLRLAVGGYKFARFFQWNETAGDWMQRGSDVEYPGSFEGELCVSSDGNAFAIGQENVGINGTVGRLITFQWDKVDNDWSVNGVFPGRGEGDFFGQLCSVSGDGSFVIAAGSISSKDRIGGYVEGFTIVDDEPSSETPTTAQPTAEPSVEPSQILISRPPPTVAPTEALPTRGADAIVLSSDGNKLAIAEWTLRQRPTLISLRAIATISERNSTDGYWSVISESDASGLFVETFNEKEHALDLDMTPDASIVVFDNYYDLLVYNTSGPEFTQSGEEIAWFTGFTRTVISDSGTTLAIINAEQADSTTAKISVHDFVWNAELGVSEWVQRGGATRAGNATLEIFGVDLSSDGQTLSLASGLSSVRVMRWDSDTSVWNWIGNDPNASDREDGYTFGANVFLSPDASNLTVSAHTFVRSYSFNGTRWNQRGNDIDFPESLKGVLCDSPTSNIIAIGQPTFGSDQSGRITIYQFDGEDWAVVASVDGIAAGDNFGNVCALSSDGSTLAGTGMVETFQRVRGHVEMISVENLLKTPMLTEYGATDLVNLTNTASVDRGSESPTEAPRIDATSSGRTLENYGRYLLVLFSLILTVKVQL